jgi:chaperonin GroEL (HSP60 family)
VSVKGAQVEKDLLLTVVHWDVARPSRWYQREGLQVDRGSLSPSCVTDAERMAAGLEEPDLLINEKKIRSLKDLLPILEQIARMGNPRVLIAEDGPVRAKIR